MTNREKFLHTHKHMTSFPFPPHCWDCTSCTCRIKHYLTFLWVWLHAVAFMLLHVQRILLFILQLSIVYLHSAGGLLLNSRGSLRSVLLSSHRMGVASVPCHKYAYGSVALKSKVILRRKVKAMTYWREMKWGQQRPAGVWAEVRETQKVVIRLPSRF